MLFEVLTNEFFGLSYLSGVNVKTLFPPHDRFVFYLTIIVLPSHKHNSLKECGEFPVSSWGIWFVFPVAGSQFIFFLLPSLTSRLDGGFTEGYRGECQEPLIRLMLSITQTPDLHEKLFSFVSKTRVLLLDGYLNEGQTEAACKA